MEAEGLQIPNVETAVKKIREIDDTSPSSIETLKIFLEIGGGEKFFEIGCNELNKNFSSTHPLEPMNKAQEILYQLSQNHLLALVTAGVEERQRAKIEKAGIEPSVFSKIIVCDTTEKGVHYQELAREMRVAPSEVLVCGDRIETDLLPAKQLGFSTVHMRQGRGRNEPRYHQAVDKSILQLSEFQELVSVKQEEL